MPMYLLNTSLSRCGLLLIGNPHNSGAIASLVKVVMMSNIKNTADITCEISLQISSRLLSVNDGQQIHGLLLRYGI